MSGTSTLHADHPCQVKSTKNSGSSNESCDDCPIYPLSTSLHTKMEYTKAPAPKMLHLKPSQKIQFYHLFLLVYLLFNPAHKPNSRHYLPSKHMAETDTHKLQMLGNISFSNAGANYRTVLPTAESEADLNIMQSLYFWSHTLTILSS